jgi:(E)-4-hydroxy-3-methylbut-2-enyl-diphosphate synthase
MFEPFNDSVFQTEGSENLSLNMIGNSDDIPSNCLDVNSSGINRRKTIEVNVGDVVIGGDAPISVQSMCNTFTYDVKSTVNQIHSLEEAGCEIIRLAVPDEKSVVGLKEIRKETKTPLVADIHFDYRLAIMAAEAGVDCLRINPGNINGEDRVTEVVSAAKDHGLSIRIGVNAGSLEKHLLDRYGGATPEAMVESGLRHIGMLEKRNFNNTKISLKASDVMKTVQAYRLMAQKVEYPFHLGITESGSLATGSVKSSVGLGLLLSEGIGDTMRVSLAADPTEEVRVAYEILKSLKLRSKGVNVIACPSCGRVQIDVDKLTSEVEKELSHIKEPITVAVMGCEVNGPGEARDADIGVAGGHKRALIFSKGEKDGLVDYSDIKNVLVEKVEALAEKYKLENQKQES